MARNKNGNKHPKIPSTGQESGKFSADPTVPAPTSPAKNSACEGFLRLPRITEPEWQLACNQVVEGLSKHLWFKIQVIGFSTASLALLSLGLLALFNRSTQRDIQDEIRKQLEVEKIIPEIQKAVEKKVDSITEDQIRQKAAEVIEPKLRDLDAKIDTSFDEIEELGLIADLVSRTRLAERRGFEALVNIRLHPATASRVRQYVRDLIGSIIADYTEKTMKAGWLTDSAQAKRALRDLAMFSIDEKSTDGEIISLLVKAIKEDESLNNLAIDFIALNSISGMHFQVFDFEDVKAWDKSGRPKSWLNPARPQ